MILGPLNCSYREDRRMLRELPSDTSPKEVYLDLLQRTMMPVIWEQIVLHLNQFSYVVPDYLGRGDERVFSIVLATDRRMSPSEKEQMEEEVRVSEWKMRNAVAAQVAAEAFRDEARRQRDAAQTWALSLEKAQRRPLVRFAMWLSDLWERAWE